MLLKEREFFYGCRLCCSTGRKNRLWRIQIFVCAEEKADFAKSKVGTEFKTYRCGMGLNIFGKFLTLSMRHPIL